MFIRVMTEVKIREDEYDLIQKFAACIQGLPPSAQLATRERRFLHQGTLNLMDVKDNNPSAAGAQSRISSYFPPGSIRGANTANRTSKLMTAMNQWDSGRARSGSASSSSTGLSTSSTSSGFSSGAPATPDSPFFSSFRIPMPRGRLNQARAPTIKNPPTPSPAPRNSSNAPSHVSGMLIQVFVFTDLVLLAAPASDETDGWTLLKHIGIIRALDVHLPLRSRFRHHHNRSTSRGTSKAESANEDGRRFCVSPPPCCPQRRHPHGHGRRCPFSTREPRSHNLRLDLGLPALPEVHALRVVDPVTESRSAARHGV